MFCTKCQSERMRRIKREGFLHIRVAPLFGYYPWRCSTCATVQLIRARGKKESMPGANKQEKEDPAARQLRRKPLG